MSDGLTEYVLETANSSKKNLKQYQIFGFVSVFIKDPLPDHINILKVMQEIEDKVPYHIVNDVDAIYVGKFKEFEEKQVNAMYRDGAVYVTNDQDNDEDMIDDIIHEFAHAAEEIFARLIYGDQLIQQEFLGKRKRLRDLIYQYGYLDGKEISFSELDYSKELDVFLHKELGYSRLDNFCTGLFIRPYAVTDVREYFATALEEYLLGDRDYLKKISPVAYKKVALTCSPEEV